MSQLFIALLVIIRIQSISLGCRCHAAQIHVCVVGKWIALRPYCYLYPASPSLRTRAITRTADTFQRSIASSNLNQIASDPAKHVLDYSSERLMIF